MLVVGVGVAGALLLATAVGIFACSGRRQTPMTKYDDAQASKAVPATNMQQPSVAQPVSVEMA